jgi:hypothetical protein
LLAKAFACIPDVESQPLRRLDRGDKPTKAMGRATTALAVSRSVGRYGALSWGLGTLLRSVVRVSIPVFAKRLEHSPREQLRLGYLKQVDVVAGKTLHGHGPFVKFAPAQ